MTTPTKEWTKPVLKMNFHRTFFIGTNAKIDQKLGVPAIDRIFYRIFNYLRSIFRRLPKNCLSK